MPNEFAPIIEALAPLAPVAPHLAVGGGLVFSLAGVRIWPWFLRAMGVGCGAALGYGLGWLAQEAARHADRPFAPEHIPWVLWGPTVGMALLFAYAATRSYRFMVFSAGFALGSSMGGAVAAPAGLAEHARWVALGAGILMGLACLKAERVITILGTALAGSAGAVWGAHVLLAERWTTPIPNVSILGAFVLLAGLGAFVQWRSKTRS